jgi:hypothetical protein
MLYIKTPLIPAFIHMDVMYASNAGAFTCLPEGEGVYLWIFADWVWIIHYRYAEISLI